MSKGKHSNVSPIRKIKSYKQLHQEAGSPSSGGLKMMADAEASGDLANQLGYTAGAEADLSPQNTSVQRLSGAQPAILPAGSASTSPQTQVTPPATDPSLSTT
jgi:hypothetical protein